MKPNLYYSNIFFLSRSLPNVSKNKRDLKCVKSQVAIKQHKQEATLYVDNEIK